LSLKAINELVMTFMELSNGTERQHFPARLHYFRSQ